MEIYCLWPILLLWIFRTFSILIIRDWYYKDVYNGKWHEIENNTKELGMNTPKGLLIRNRSGRTTTSSVTITPPISNKMIVCIQDSEDKETWKVTKRPLFDRLIHLLSFET